MTLSSQLGRESTGKFINAMQNSQEIGFKSKIATMIYGYFWIIVPSISMGIATYIHLLDDHGSIVNSLKAIFGVIIPLVGIALFLLRNFIYYAEVHPQNRIIRMTLIGNRKKEKRLDELTIIFGNRFYLVFDRERYTTVWHDWKEILGAMPPNTPIKFEGLGGRLYKRSLKSRGIDDPAKLLGTVYK